MLEVRNLEWLNHNSNRAYPLCASASARSDTDEFELPQDFLVSLYLSVHAGQAVDPARFFVKTVGVYSSGYSVTIGYQPETGAAIVVASAMLAKTSHVFGRSYRLSGLGDFLDATGFLVIGELRNIDQQPAGQWELAFEAGQLEPDAVRPQLRGVTGLRVQNGDDTSARLVGDVTLVAGENIRLTVTDGEDGPVVTIDAIAGEGLNLEEETDANYIRFINGIGPNAAGNFVLSGNECLEISAVEGGLRLNDVCSKPCCGCTELETVTETLSRMKAQAQTLSTFVARLEASMAVMSQALSRSNLSGESCLLFQSDAIVGEPELPD